MYFSCCKKFCVFQGLFTFGRYTGCHYDTTSKQIWHLFPIIFIANFILETEIPTPFSKLALPFQVTSPIFTISFRPTTFHLTSLFSSPNPLPSPFSFHVLAMIDGQITNTVILLICYWSWKFSNKQVVDEQILRQKLNYLGNLEVISSKIIQIQYKTNLNFLVMKIHTIRLSSIPPPKKVN